MFNIPRVVAVSPQLRLVEDNLSSISLLDIYRRVCKKREMQYDEPVIDYYEKLALLQVGFNYALLLLLVSLQLC